MQLRVQSAVRVRRVLGRPTPERNQVVKQFLLRGVLPIFFDSGLTLISVLVFILERLILVLLFILERLFLLLLLFTVVVFIVTGTATVLKL